MKAVMLGEYDSFRCLAGACPSTCCAGWAIRVDEIDYMRFQGLEMEWLRHDILSNISKSGNEYFFQNQKDGRCAMLDSDGLCRIQRNTSEDVLCNTCRKYPRLLGVVRGVLYLSMAASCPVVSAYLVRGCVCFKAVDDFGVSTEIAAEGLEFTRYAWELYQQLWELAWQLRQEHFDNLLLYRCFEKMAAGVLEIITVYREKSMPADLFRALETDTSGRICSFADAEGGFWKKIVDNYVKYRIFTRRIEFPEEDVAVCVRRVQAELVLLRTAAFCRYCEKGVLSCDDWQELLQRMYRFCAHGDKVSGAFGNLVQTFFSQDVLWSYMLF